MLDGNISGNLALLKGGGLTEAQAEGRNSRPPLYVCRKINAVVVDIRRILDIVGISNPNCVRGSFRRCIGWMYQPTPAPDSSRSQTDSPTPASVMTNFAPLAPTTAATAPIFQFS